MNTRRFSTGGGRMSLLTSRVSPFASIEEEIEHLNRDWISDNERDLTVREAYKAGMALPQEYTSEEEEFVKVGLAHLAMMDVATSSSIRRVPVNGMPHSLRSPSILENKEDPHGVYGSASCTFLGSTVEDIVATFFDRDSVYMSGKHDHKNPHIAERRTVEIPNFHRYIGYTRNSLPRPLQDRDGAWSMIWKRLGPTQVLHLAHSTHHPSVPVYHDVVRADYSRSFLLTQTSTSVVTCDFVFRVDMKGIFPKSVVKAWLVPGSMNGLLRMQQSRACLISLNELDDGGDDASLLAELLLEIVKKTRSKDDRKRAVLTFFYRSVALREASSRYPWLAELFLAIFANRLKRTKKVTISDLDHLTAAEAKSIGESFAMTLVRSSTFIAATDEWIVTNPALKALDVELPLFRPFVNRISKHLLETATWGAKARVVFGAVLSVADMASDTNVIRQFYEQGEVAAANAIVAMICVNILIQLMLVVVQNKRKSKSTLVLEFFYAITFVKPGVDALRVIRGGEKDPLLAVSPETESAYSKAAEISLEAIPGGILQTVILLRSKNTTTSALVSVALSAMTAAYTSSALAFDVDTSPPERINTPTFYGYIPDHARASMFCLIFILSLTQVAAKVFAVALLATANFGLLIIWLSTDVLLLFVYKATRRDLIRWVPIRGRVKYAAVAVMLPINKFMCDFLGLAHMRHPLELGGAYYFYSVLQSQISCWVAAYLYTSSGNSAVNPTGIFYFVGALQAVWLFSGILFFLKMDRRYWSTFFSLTSGRDYVQAIFLENKNDSGRVRIFLYQDDLWSDLREDVKTWVQHNWLEWIQERPSWLTEKVKAHIPTDFLPADLSSS